MLEDQIAEMAAIIDALVARTRERRVAWDWDQSSLQCTAELANGWILVAKDRDGDTVVTIQDTEEVTLETINVGFHEYAELRVSADSLYELARRSALQVDSKLESILQEITN